jgi:hypothetical protein
LKTISLLLLNIFICFSIHCQSISGTITDSASGKPIAYANIELLNSSTRAITNEDGTFFLKLTEYQKNPEIRVSMIGYKTIQKSFTEHLQHNVEITLVPVQIPLKEIIVKPSGKIKKMGNSHYSRTAKTTGWTGTESLIGDERGIVLDIGKEPVELRKFFVHISSQSYDSCMFRLHIRNIKDNYPSEELLYENIYLTITEESGWNTFDLKNYNIILKDKILISLEYIKAYNINPNRTILIGHNIYNDYIIISNTGKHLSYNKYAPETDWHTKPGLLAMYLEVSE